MYIFLNVFSHICAEESSQQRNTKEMIAQIRDILELPYSSDKQERTKRKLKIQELHRNILEAGRSIVALLELSIDSETNVKVRNELIRIFGKIPGEEVDRKLLYLLYHEDVNGIALSIFISRREQYGDLSFRVSDDDIEEIIKRVEQEDVLSVDGYMAVLDSCAMNPEEPRYYAITNRFYREFKYPSKIEYIIQGSYTSPQALVLNRLLSAFKKIGKVIRPYIREAIVKAKEENDIEVEKALYMALGITGDSDVSDYLKCVIQNETDPYIRGEVIRSYAISAKKDAVPLLKELINDGTISKYIPQHEPPFFINSAIAKGELIRLTEEDFNKSAYIQELNKMLSSRNIDKDELYETGSDQIYTALSSSKEYLPISKEIEMAFIRNDTDYIRSFIKQRQKQNNMDILALLVEFDLNVSCNYFQDSLNNIDMMFEYLAKDDNPCKQYNSAIIYVMSLTFESKYREYWINSNKETSETTQPKMGCALVLYILESHECL